MLEGNLPARKFYSITAARTLFGRGVTWIYREIAAGRLKAVKDGRNTLITAESVEKRIAAFTPATTPTLARMAQLAGEALDPDPVFMPVSPATGPKRRKAVTVGRVKARRRAGRSAVE